MARDVRRAREAIGRVPYVLRIPTNTSNTHSRPPAARHKHKPTSHLLVATHTAEPEPHYRKKS